MIKKPVWCKEKLKEKNCTLAFTYDFSGKIGDEIHLSVTASNIYKLYIDNTLLGYGPARAAHGFSRIDEYSFKAEKSEFRITVEVVSYQVNSYYLIMGDPFFDCNVTVNSSLIAVSSDFICYHLNDRVQKVQRYSFQRPFVESYRGFQRETLRLKQSVDYPIIETCDIEPLEYLPRGVAYPRLELVYPTSMIEKGSITINSKNKLWQDRSHTDISETLLGYPNDKVEEMISDEVCRFEYIKDSEDNNSYKLYEFPFLQTGLINLEVEVLEDCDIYLVFEEILWQEDTDLKENEPLNLCFWRGECANIIKYRLKKGIYSLQSFEIYTLKYLKIINIGGKAKVNSVSVTVVETPSARDFKFRIDDTKLQEIFVAALNTFSQNSLDLFMDCPARERAGWTNDSYFTADSSRLFTGEHLLESNFIENIISSPDLEHLPEGVLPMCYPCDHLDGVYSATCSMWFALQTIKYCKEALDGKMPEHIKNRICRLINFFDKYLNEDGLIEDLGGWVFIEWSIANSPDYVCGVNYPTNMLYYKMLLDFGEITGDKNLVSKSKAVKEKILEQSFNGKYFEDNRVREGGKLVLKGHASETCQYFAFFLGLADKDRYYNLFNSLADKCKYKELSNDNKDPHRSNIIIGLILRETLLLEDGRIDQVIEECKEILYKMAIRTGTLWENVDIRASCNHNVASYFAVVLTYALTGYRGIKNGKILMDRQMAGIDCEFSFKRNNTAIDITVKDGTVVIKSDYEVLYN